MSLPFQEMIKTAAGRQQFVKSSATLVESPDVFDGIDLGWNSPTGGGLTTDEWPQKTKLSDAGMAWEKTMHTSLLKDLHAPLGTLSI